jgi:hypothetical protein
MTTVIGDFGNNTLVPEGPSPYEDNFAYGDALEMSIYSPRGGDDYIVGWAYNFLWFNSLYGEAYSMADAIGGNDTIIGGDYSRQNQIWGETYTMIASTGGELGGNLRGHPPATGG